jgi:hypothetical protein
MNQSKIQIKHAAHQKQHPTCSMKLLIAYSCCHLGVERFSGDEFNDSNWHSSIAFMAAEAASEDENERTVSLLCSNMTSLWGAEAWAWPVTGPGCDTWAWRLTRNTTRRQWTASRGRPRRGFSVCPTPRRSGPR